MNARHNFGRAHAMALVIWLSAAVAAQGQHQSADVGFAVSAGNNEVYIGGQAEGPIPPKAQNIYLGGNGDSFLEAYDQEGNLKWTAEFGSPEQDRVLGVASDATGVYAAGFTMGPMTGQTYYGATDAYVAKFSLTGEQLWLHQFGGPKVDRLQAAASDGQFLYVTGYTAESLYDLPFAGEQDCFAQKWDQEGNLVWTLEFGTPGTDRCYGIAVNTQGVFIAGRTDNAFAGCQNLGYLDAFVTMLDFDGNQKWLNQFGTPLPERGWGIATDATGVYVTGRTGGAFPGYRQLGGDDAYMAKFDYEGNALWVNQFGTPELDRGNGAATDPTGVYGVGLTAGALPGNVNLGSDDCFIRKWDPAGDVLWTVEFGSAGLDQCWGAATDSTGVYVSGTAGAALAGYPEDGDGGFFLEKFDVNGNSIWTRQVAVAGGSGS